MLSLEGAKERQAYARANSAAEKSRKNGTSPPKEQERDGEQTEHDGHNAVDSHDPRNGAKSLQIEELSIKNTKQQNFRVLKDVKYNMSSRFGAENLKGREEPRTCLEKLRREAKEREIFKKSRFAERVGLQNQDSQKGNINGECFEELWVWLPNYRTGRDTRQQFDEHLQMDGQNRRS